MVHDQDKKDEAEFKPDNFWEAAYDRPLENGGNFSVRFTKLIASLKILRKIFFQL
mgnify:CR=1 FL=1